MNLASMLIDSLHRLAANPAIYDLIQRAAGCSESIRRVGTITRATQEAIVLDAGAGTGIFSAAVPEAGQYIWLDTDPEKLAGYKRRKAGQPVHAILGDASLLPFSEKAIDIVLCIAMCHHMDDSAARALFAELARVCRRRLVFVDPLGGSRSPISKALWRLDRGTFPRTAPQLRALVAERFRIEEEQEYSIYHTYWLCAASPLRP